MVALGELLIDFTENGVCNQGNGLFEACPGGAPCNVLAMLRKLGKSCAFVGKVGDDILYNTKAQVKDKNGDAIEGLYVCGDNAGGFFYNNYPCVMPGIAMGRNMTFAIKAVKTAFELEG